MNGTLWTNAISRLDGGSADGIHLLWVPPHSAGYSVLGFDIQRRASIPKQRSQCVSLTPDQLDALHSSFRLSLGFADLEFAVTACPVLPPALPDNPFVPSNDQPKIPKDPTVAESGTQYVTFDQATVGSGPNPREVLKMSFLVWETRARRANSTEVVNLKGLIGLDCRQKLRIELPAPADQVELILLAPTGAVQTTATNKNGKVMAQGNLAPSPQPHAILLTGPKITAIDVDSPKKRALLLRIGCRWTLTQDARTRLVQRRMAKLVPPAVQAAITSMTRSQASISTTPVGLVAPNYSLASYSPHCSRYRVRFRKPERGVIVMIGVPVVLAIALREGMTVFQTLATQPAGAPVVRFAGRVVDEILLYVGFPARSLRICVEPEKDDDQEWRRVPYIARGVQLPIKAVNADVHSAADELALARSRLIPGENLDSPQFHDVAKLLNEAAAHVDVVSPVFQVSRRRERAEDPFVDTRSWDLSFALLGDPAWRRALGFGFLDERRGLVPGDTYDYRITGHFRRRDVLEEWLGFHTVPSGTLLPLAFYLGPLRFDIDGRVTVDVVPDPTGLGGTGRKGIQLPGGIRLRISYPTAVQRLVLEVEPNHDFHYAARTSDFIFGLSGVVFQNPLPAGPRVELNFAEPIDTIELTGVGVFYGVRLGDPGNPNDILTLSEIVYGVRYEVTPPPPPPPYLGTTHLQQPVVVGDARVTTQDPPTSLGFKLSWLPPPLSGNPQLLPWPPDLAAAPPFDVLGFQLERRRVDVPSGFVDVDDNAQPTIFAGNRGSRREPDALGYGIDLLQVFPERPAPQPPVSPFMTVDDVLVKADSLTPPPGSLHEYQIYSVDVVGRRSSPTVGSVVRLEKRRPPPQPVAPDSAPPLGVVAQPSGVRARVIQASDPNITAADQDILGTSENVILLEWGWTDQERSRDPWAHEFRIYWQPNPPDAVRGELTGTPTLAGSVIQMAAHFDDGPIASDIIKGRYLISGDKAFRISSQPAGQDVTLTLDLNPLDPGATPAPMFFNLQPNLAGEIQRPAAWAERVAAVPISAAAPDPFVLRDRLVLDPAHPRIRVWVGVSAADDQSYVPDDFPGGGRPGNESSIAIAEVNARYIGRPAFVVPLPLADVPEQVTDEPIPGGVRTAIDVPGLLPALPVPAGYNVLLERLPFDQLIPMLGRGAAGSVRVTLPDGTVEEYTLANPADRAALAAQLASGEAARIEGRFLMDFLFRYLAKIESFWQRALPAPVALSILTDKLPEKPGRYAYRLRLADPSGHLSGQGAIVPKIVRVPSLVPTRAPEFTLAGDVSDAIKITAVLTDSFELGWLLLFHLELPLDSTLDDRTLQHPQLLRLPNRRDLYPDDGIRLRLHDGTLLSPMVVAVAGAPVQPPRRTLTHSLVVGFDQRVAVWAVALSRDGIPSRFTGPILATSGPMPLHVPAVNVTATATGDTVTWTAVPVPAEFAIERTTDAGATWTRVSPWLAPDSLSHTVRPGGLGAQYRLLLRANRNRTAQSSVV